MMIAIYQAESRRRSAATSTCCTPARRCACPKSADFDTLATTVANAEVQRQTDEWQNRARRRPAAALAAGRDADGGAHRRRLLPPAHGPTRSRARRRPAAARGAEAGGRRRPPPPEERRLLEVRNAELQNLQAGRGRSRAPRPHRRRGGGRGPGVELESEQLFADETEPAPEPVAEDARLRRPRPRLRTPVADRAVAGVAGVGWLLSPLLWIGLGVAALAADGALVRAAPPPRDRGRHGSLGSARIGDRRRSGDSRRDGADAPSGARARRSSSRSSTRLGCAAPSRARAAPPARGAAPRPQTAASPADETLSSQTVINLDQADAVAEADFHIAYGLYDQAAELVQKALEAAPDRRDLKLKLLEVFFMWGNKDAFLKAAQGLRADIGQCRRRGLGQGRHHGQADLPRRALVHGSDDRRRARRRRSQAGDSPLDLAFDDAASADVASLRLPVSTSTSKRSDERPAPKAGREGAGARARLAGDDSLDIGARTAAGLEAALFEDHGAGRRGSRTTPGRRADSLAVTQESPTIERPGQRAIGPRSRARRRSSPPKRRPSRHRRSRARRPGRACDDATSKTVAIAAAQRIADRSSSPRCGASTSEFTAEIDLDDLGLDVKDIEGLPGDLGDLADGRRRATRTRASSPHCATTTRCCRQRASRRFCMATTTTSSSSARRRCSKTRMRRCWRPVSTTRRPARYGHRGARRPARGRQSGNTSLVKSLRGKDDDGSTSISPI